MGSRRVPPAPPSLVWETRLERILKGSERAQVDLSQFLRDVSSKKDEAVDVISTVLELEGRRMRTGYPAQCRKYQADIAAEMLKQTLMGSSDALWDETENSAAAAGVGKQAATSGAKVESCIGEQQQCPFVGLKGAVDIVHVGLDPPHHKYNLSLSRVRPA